MAIPFASDLTAIMNTDEFAVSATYVRAGGLGSSTITGIFDNMTIPVDSGGFVQVHEEQPRFTCTTSSVPNIVESDQIVLSGTNYTVRAWVHDGTGVTIIQLERT